MKLLRCTSTALFLRLLFCVLFFFSPIHSLDDFSQVVPGKKYVFLNDPIDVVIPCVEKDLETLELCIEGIRKNCVGLRKIFILSAKKLTNSADWIDEKQYPFSKSDVARELFETEEEAREYLAHPQNRVGWIYQQLLKLYASFVIKGISSNVLVLDSDTIFLKSVSFINQNGAAFFNVGTEHHLPYFEHMQNLLPNLRRGYLEYSGICHHMLFQKCVLTDLQSHIETYHKKPMWKALLHCMNPRDLFGSGLSEYEIYFNFALFRSTQFTIRPLQWANVSLPSTFPQAWKDVYHYVSAHTYLRGCL